MLLVLQRAAGIAAVPLDVVGRGLQRGGSLLKGRKEWAEASEAGATAVQVVESRAAAGLSWG